ncbi:unnamed protein product [Choristocarpus tenellus]
MIATMAEGLLRVVTGSDADSGFVRERVGQARGNPWEKVAEKLTGFFNVLINTTLEALKYVIVVEVLLLSAGAFYALLYWLVMPAMVQERLVYLDYAENTLGGPTGTVDFLAEHTQWEPSHLTEVHRLGDRQITGAWRGGGEES